MERHYPNAPLQQAVCEIRFQTDDSWDLATPGLIYSHLSEDYPRRLPPRSTSVKTILQVGPEGIQQNIVSEETLRFWRKDDEAGEIEVSRDRLAIRHLQPYPSWEGYLPIIEQALNAYCDVASPSALNRIGLRYVNQIYFKERTVVELEDFFDLYPFLGPNLPQDYVSFITGVQIPYDDDRDVLRLQLATGKPDEERRITFILDLDYFRFPASEIDFASVCTWLEQAHGHISEVFEGCLKPKMRDRFSKETV